MDGPSSYLYLNQTDAWVIWPRPWMLDPFLLLTLYFKWINLWLNCGFCRDVEYHLLKENTLKEKSVAWVTYLELTLPLWPEGNNTKPQDGQVTILSTSLDPDGRRSGRSWLPFLNRLVSGRTDGRGQPGTLLSASCWHQSMLLKLLWEKRRRLSSIC